MHSSDSGLRRVCALYRVVIDVHVHYKRISVTLVCALLIELIVIDVHYYSE